MLRKWRQWCYLMCPPRENPELIGRKVIGGAKIDGVWKYNQDEGVIVGSEADTDRRVYRIVFDEYVLVCPLPVDNFRITDETVTELPAATGLPAMRLTPRGGWHEVGSGYCEYVPEVFGTPRWWRQRAKKILRPLRRAYYRRWPPPELYVGRQVRALGTRGRRRLPEPGRIGAVVDSHVSDEGVRLYGIEFDGRVIAHTQLPSSQFALVDESNKSDP